MSTTSSAKCHCGFAMLSRADHFKDHVGTFICSMEAGVLSKGPQVADVAGLDHFEKGLLWSIKYKVIKYVHQNCTKNHILSPTGGSSS